MQLISQIEIFFKKLKVYFLTNWFSFFNILFRKEKLLLLNGKLFLFLLVLALSACKNQTYTKLYQLENIEFKIEGPLFEGANSAQYEVVIDKAKLLSEQQNIDNIKEAKLVSCDLVASDSSDFSNLSGFVLQLTAENSEMTEIALADKVNGGKSVKLKASDKEVTNFFKQNKFILLMDSYLKKDQEESMKFTANIVFEVKVNQ